MDENNNDVMYDLIDDINVFDEDLIDSEKTPGKYYIGNYFIVIGRKRERMLLDMVISPNALYEFPFNVVAFYMYEYSFNKSADTIEILQICPYSRLYANGVVIKTIWLKLVQRHWKKVFKERKDIARKRASFSAQRAFELRGNYGRGSGLNTFPTIRGMMSVYKTRTAAAAPL